MVDCSHNPISLKDFQIPACIFAPESRVEHDLYVPTCPVLVFINSKSGGQLGGDLLVTYRGLLNKDQVFDVGQEAPNESLHRVYANLERLKGEGNKFATEIEERLKLIVAGGDGTAGWLLGVVCDLKLPRPPPIATVPLGTGNNLPFAFGWGKKNPGTDPHAVKSFLDQVMKAKEMNIDSWHILLRMKDPKDSNYEPIAVPELPHSLHTFCRVSSSDELNMEGYHTFRGGFWNYFSMGMDAQVSYAFHSERKKHPEKFKNQLVNQGTYIKLICTQGSLHRGLRSIAELASVKIMKKHGSWEDLNIPHTIKSIICLNLPSFSGGLNPWGNPTGKRSHEKGFTPPYVDDGLIEIVGFKDAWHGLVLFAPMGKGHGTRLAQAHRVRFEFHKGASETYMRIDGEPWKQPLPPHDDTVVVEISHHGQVKMLATHNCRSKSTHDPSGASNNENEEEEEPNEEEEEDSKHEGEEWRKFGAADTFKMPEEGEVEVDISRLS